MKKGQFFQQMLLMKLNIHMWKNKIEPLSINIQKLTQNGSNIRSKAIKPLEEIRGKFK